jgi:hypothetical protein
VIADIEACLIEKLSRCGFTSGKLKLKLYIAALFPCMIEERHFASDLKDAV